VARFWANESIPMDELEVTAYRYQPFLTSNQEVAPVDYKTLPSYNSLTHFTTEQGTGQFLQRSSWDNDAQWVSFKASPRYGDHAHNGPGHFSIYENGWLVIDRNIQSHSGIEGADSLHNCIHFERMNSVQYYQNEQHSIFEQTEFTDEYSYLSVNSTPEYVIRQNNIVSKSTRKFFYLPTVKSVILFDIAETKLPAQKKSFGINFNGNPDLSNNMAVTYANKVTKVVHHPLYPIAREVFHDDVLVRIKNQQAIAKDYFVNLIYTQPKSETPRRASTLSTESSSVLYSSAKGAQFIVDDVSYAVLSTSDSQSQNGSDSLVYDLPVSEITKNYLLGMEVDKDYFVKSEAATSPAPDNFQRTRVFVSNTRFDGSERVHSTASGVLVFPVLLNGVPTGTKEIPDGVYIYPNPVSNCLVVKSDNGEILDWQLLSIDGTTMLSDMKVVSGRHLEINTENLPNGTYIFRALRRNGSFTYKFIKE
jgi:hypothetical protein